MYNLQRQWSKLLTNALKFLGMWFYIFIAWLLFLTHIKTYLMSWQTYCAKKTHIFDTLNGWMNEWTKWKFKISHSEWFTVRIIALFIFILVFLYLHCYKSVLYFLRLTSTIIFVKKGIKNLFNACICLALRHTIKIHLDDSSDLNTSTSC